MRNSDGRLTVRIGQSFLGVCNTTGIQHRVEGLDGAASVADMLSLATTSGGALSLKGPGEADLLVSVLGDGDVMSLHEG